MNLRECLVEDLVGDLAIAAAVSVRPEETIRATIKLMQQSQSGCVLVQTGDQLCGLFTERDVVTRVLSEGVSLDQAVSSVMTTEVDTLLVTDSVADVIRRMHSGGYRHMVVVDAAGAVTGVISVKRIVQYLVDHFPSAVYNLPPEPNVTATAREGS